MEIPNMNWNEYQVSNWITDLARRREIDYQADQFVEKKINAQKLWDYRNYYTLKDTGVPTVGLRLTIYKLIENTFIDNHQ